MSRFLQSVRWLVLLTPLLTLAAGAVQADGGKRYKRFHECLAEAKTQSERNHCHWRFQGSGRGR